jgi:hypothetical protein
MPLETARSGPPRKIRAIRLLTAVVAAAAGSALAACGTVTPASTPTPPPSTNLTVNYPVDNKGIFFMATGQTLLVGAAAGYSHNTAVLMIAGHYDKAIVFKAVGLGRVLVNAGETPACNVECNPPQPFQITVVVVSDAELQQGVLISEQDQSPLLIHLRSQQRFVISLHNQAGSPPWSHLSVLDPAVIVPEQPAVVSADGIRGLFRTGEPRLSVVVASGPDCSEATCWSTPYAKFTVQVFS